MSKSDPSRAPGRSRAGRDRSRSEGGEPETDEEEVLALLCDEHARRVLGALDGGALAAAEIVERLDVSRATVYRRLDRLESADIVESTMSVRLDGAHRRRFRLVVDRATLRFGDDGVSVALDR